MQLVDDGRLELDAPVRAYLPWFEVAEPDAAADITVRHLLGHASGLSDRRYLEQPGLGDDATMEAGVRDLRRAAPVAPPGAEFHANVLQARGMDHTYTDPDAARAVGLARGHLLAFGVACPREQRFRAYGLPAGYLMSTANDMARFVLAMNGGGVLDGVHVLSRSRMFELHAPSPPSGFYAAGWIVGSHRGHRVVQHGGTNEYFKTEAVLVPDLDLGVVLLALAFVVQLAWIARDATRLPRWRTRALRWRAPRVALAVAPHLLVVPVIALAGVELVGRLLGRGGRATRRPRLTRRPTVRTLLRTLSCPRKGGGA